MRSQHESTFFDDDRLWAELERPDGERKQAALRAIDALADLATLRARFDGSTYEKARREIYSSSRLELNLGAEIPTAAAFRVLDELADLAALRALETDSKDEREASPRLGSWIRKRLAEMRCDEQVQVGE